MNTSKLTSIISFLGLVATGAVVYAVFLNAPKPCEMSIEYSIGQFDERFELTQPEFLAAIAQAEAIWESAAGRELFTHAEAGKMKINLVYDYRQEASAKLQDLGFNIEATQSSYNELKSHYDAQVQSYNSNRHQLEAMIDDFETRKQKYDQQVNHWNSQGGAPRAEADKLNAERDALNRLADQIRQKQNTVNALASDVNNLVKILNSLSEQLNLNVERYNTIGTSRGEEFEEGVYVFENGQAAINIYEFTERNELIRLLAHELGHALQMEHVDDPEAIMYRLNESANTSATAADLAELTRVCR